MVNKKKKYTSIITFTSRGEKKGLGSYESKKTKDDSSSKKDGND